jgi:hypothetical protein
MLAHHVSRTETNSTLLCDVAAHYDIFRGTLADWYSTLSLRLPPDVISLSLQLCTPKVIGL